MTNQGFNQYRYQNPRQWHNSLKTILQYSFIIDYLDKWKIAIPKLPLSSEADRVATNRAVICDFWNLLCLGGVQSQTNLCTWIRFAGYNDLGLVMLKNNS